MKIILIVSIITICVFSSYLFFIFFGNRDNLDQFLKLNSSDVKMIKCNFSFNLKEETFLLKPDFIDKIKKEKTIVTSVLPLFRHANNCSVFIYLNDGKIISMSLVFDKGESCQIFINGSLYYFRNLTKEQFFEIVKSSR